MMNLRIIFTNYILIACCFCVFIHISSCNTETENNDVNKLPKPKPKPNIIIMLADDMVRIIYLLFVLNLFSKMNGFFKKKKPNKYNMLKTGFS